MWFNVNFLIVVPSLRRAGAETQAIDLANGLADRGHKVHLFTFIPDKDQLDRLNPAVRHHFSERRKKYSFRYVLELAKLLDDERIDVIHCVMQFPGLVSWIASRRSKRKPPIVIAVHTTTNHDLVSELADRLVFRPVLRRAARVVFVCRFQRDHWLEKYPELEDRSIVVYNGIDTGRYSHDGFLAAGQELRAKLSIGEEAFVFSCVAAFRPEKGHDLLVEAFAGLPESAVLLLAGEGVTRPSAEKAVQEAGLSERVRFLGNLADVRPLMAASNATILASTAVETFSIAMLESLAMATPMIAPQIGGLPEAIADGKTGLLFPVGDVQAMAGCMKTLLTNPGMAKQLGISGREKVGREFAMEAMITESEQVLAAAIDQS